jgi:DNA-binding beta-propeller fold protein YncE
VVVAIDLATQAIVKRIPVPGGGEGEMAVSPDQKTVYFASNKSNHFFVIGSATYAFEAVPYPLGGRGCMSLLRHPTKPLLYIGISRGGRIAGRPYPYANCYVATYDLERRVYVGTAQLAEIVNGQTDDATPECLTYDAVHDRVYVGMFQSRRGICVLDADTCMWRRDVRFERTSNNTTPFPWVDPLHQAIAGALLLSVNHHNRELVSLDRESLEPKTSICLGNDRNGPSDLVVWQDYAIVSNPALQGLHFVPLSALA